MSGLVKFLRTSICIEDKQAGNFLYPSKLLVLLSCLAVFLPSLFSSPVQAGEVQADVSSYCREKFGHTAFSNVDRRDNGIMCSLRTDGGLGLRHHKVNAADICVTLHGTPQYRRDGAGVICIQSGPGGASPAGREINLEQYCRKNYGPNAIVTERRTDGTPMCSVRTDGGLGLRHHVIDTNAVCGPGGGRVTGNTIRCGTGFGPVPGPGGPFGPSGGLPPWMTKQPGKPSASNLPPKKTVEKPDRIIDTKGSGRLFDRNITQKDLNDCGMHGLPGENFTLAMRSPHGIGGWGWEYAAVTLSCPALINGKKVSFKPICDQFNDSKGLRITPSGKPVCWGGVWWPPHPEQMNQPAMRGTMLSPTCLAAYYGRIGAPASEQRKNEDQVVPIVKYSTGQPEMECFYIKIDQLKQLRSGGTQEQEYVEDEM